MPGWPRDDHTDNCPRPDLCSNAQTCVGRCNPNSIFYVPPKSINPVAEEQLRSFGNGPAR